MAILIDANVFIQAERGLFDLENWLRSISGEDFRIAAITVAELWHGVERATSPHRAHRRLFIEHLLSIFEVEPYTPETAIEHARLWARLESAGCLIGPYDMILAATALQTGSAVATFNRRHFAPVKGLKVIEPK